MSSSYLTSPTPPTSAVSKAVASDSKLWPANRTNRSKPNKRGLQARLIIKLFEGFIKPPRPPAEKKQVPFSFNSQATDKGQSCHGFSTFHCIRLLATALPSNSHFSRCRFGVVNCLRSTVVSFLLHFAWWQQFRSLCATLRIKPETFA